MTAGSSTRRRLMRCPWPLALTRRGAVRGTALGADPGRAGVTFTKDVAPILQRSCVTCHRPGQSAPMSLLTYEDARPWARSIKTRVAAREMPPWHIDRNVGIQEFKNDLSLPDEDIATIVAWVDGGAPRGNPADMPPQRQFADGAEWAIGKPDLVVRFPAYHVPAAGPDLFPTITRADRSDRGSLHQGDPDPAGRLQLAAGRASRDHDHGRPGSDGAPREPGQRRRRRAVHRRVRVGQGAGSLSRRILACCCKAGSNLQPRNHLHSVGEEINSRGRGRLPAASEGRRAEVHPLLDASRRSDAERRRLARHPGRRGGARRRLHAPHQAGQDHRLAAAHAHPRQVSVPRADLSRRIPATS